MYEITEPIGTIKDVIEYDGIHEIKAPFNKE